MGAIRLLVLLCVVAAQIGSYKASSSSYDSLIASQCKAKCLSLYPWKQLQPSERRHRSVPIVYLPSKMVRLMPRFFSILAFSNHSNS